MNDPQRIVIVGAGECGGRAALTLREAGFDGHLTLVGEEAHAPYERPPLSKEALTGGEPPAPVFAVTPQALASRDIEFLPSTTARQIDRGTREVILGDGRNLRWDRLLLTTGAAARRLQVSDGAAVLYLRTHGEAAALRDRIREGIRVGVIGAGFIGLEVAASARVRGAEVTVFETAPAALTRIVPPPIAEVLTGRHRDAGVEIRCGVHIRQIAGTRITTSDGTVTDLDVVIAGIGSVPNTDLAARSGLRIENGIAVDTHLRTSDPDVFAAGDCCSFPHPTFDGTRLRLESWRNARDQGEAAAHNMLDRAQPYEAVPWFWSDHYDLTLQIAGLPSAADRELVRNRPDGVAIRFGVTTSGRLVSASAVGIGNAVAKDIRVAEMLIAKRATPDPALLRNPTIALKQLLRQPEPLSTSGVS